VAPGLGLGALLAKKLLSTLSQNRRHLDAHWQAEDHTQADSDTTVTVTVTRFIRVVIALWRWGGGCAGV
jgi:hypothetical protein